MNGSGAGVAAVRSVLHEVGDTRSPSPARLKALTYTTFLGGLLGCIVMATPV